MAKPPKRASPLAPMAATPLVAMEEVDVEVAVPLEAVPVVKVVTVASVT